MRDSLQHGPNRGTVQDAVGIAACIFEIALFNLARRYSKYRLSLFWMMFGFYFRIVLFSIIFSYIGDRDFQTSILYVGYGLGVWEFISATVSRGFTLGVRNRAIVEQYGRSWVEIAALETARSCLQTGLTLAPLVIFHLALSFDPFVIARCMSLAAVVIPVFLVMLPIAAAGVRLPALAEFSDSVLRFVFIISPVIFPVDVFLKSDFSLIVLINPVFHLLGVTRDFIIEGSPNFLLQYAALAVAAVAFFGLTLHWSTTCLSRWTRFRG